MTHPEVVKRLVTTQVHRLFTFASPNEPAEYLRACESYGVRGKLLIDSGAFTSWSLGKPVQLAQLLEYNLGLLRTFPHHDFKFIALDVIPGARGRMATQGEINAAVEESYRNFLTMQQALRGQTVLPVFHSGEDKFVRDRYMQHVNYLCLSPNQNLAEHQRLLWARESMVPDYYFHGLATTGNSMLSLIDWYSVDSSGWLMVAAMGNILMPVNGGLKPLSLSDTAPTRKIQGHHLSNMAEAEWIERYIRERGYDPATLATDYAARICWNIDMWNAAPWQKRDVAIPRGLFD
jgi:hypothetical protein